MVFGQGKCCKNTLQSSIQQQAIRQRIPKSASLPIFVFITVIYMHDCALALYIQSTLGEGL